MKKIVLIVLCYSSLFSLQTSEKLFECTEIFKERKSELLVELERIDEQKQALSALQAATEELLKKKETKLSAQEEIVDNKLTDITKKEANIKNMLARNEEVLKELKELKMSKIAQTFAKMKPASSANILSGMDSKEAVSILQSLKPKTVGKILTKMDAKKASELTLLLTK
ncbi:MAG: PDP protein [Sulfurimonas sp.]|nr:PDP protein [Sulfurimonas sp.]